MNKKVFTIIYAAFIVLAIAVLIFHIKGIFYPTELTPSWRHGLFAIVCCVGIYGLIKRPLWFIFFISLLTIQQWYSHGSYLIELWQNEHRIHWLSVGDIILLPILLIILLLERRTKRSPANHSHS